ncbi:hypothetical protein H0H93_006044, partial [Arthromyces matolae]
RSASFVCVSEDGEVSKHTASPYVYIDLDHYEKVGTLEQAHGTKKNEEEDPP